MKNGVDLARNGWRDEICTPFFCLALSGGEWTDESLFVIYFVTNGRRLRYPCLFIRSVEEKG